MKKVIRKSFVCLIVFIMLIGTTNITAIAQYIEDEIVNLGVFIKISTEKETVKAGEAHKVTIKNSYANPNDEDYANCRIYLTDSEGKPNELVKLQEFVDNKMVFSCQNNEDLSVTMELKEERDEENNITARYLEYILPPGTSVQMEIKFVMPNGISNPEETLILTPEITHNGEKKENDYATEKTELKWTSEFKWENLQKKANINTISINKDNKFTKNITYNFSAENSNGTIGNIWTDRVEITDTLTLPDEVNLPEDITYQNNNIYVGENILYTITLPESYIGNYTINELKVENKKIIFTITITNLNQEEGIVTSNFNPMSDLSTTLYSDQLNIQDGYLPDGTKKIINTVQATFYPVSEKADSIKINAEKDITIQEEQEVVTLSKSVDKREAMKNDEITYTINLRNQGRKTVTRTFEDKLPEGTILSTEGKNALLEQGYTISEEEPYSIRKDITIEAGEEKEIQIPVTINTSEIITIVNTAKYGDLTSSATTEVNKNELELDKKLIRRWAKYATNGYQYEVLQQNSSYYESMGLGGWTMIDEGDRIEYEITLTNNSNEEKTVTLCDILPEANRTDSYMGSNFNLQKLYVIGINYAQDEKYKMDFKDHLLEGYNNSNPYHAIKLKIPAKTTLKQTYIMDTPTGQDYTKLLDCMRYNLGYIYPVESDNQELPQPFNKIYIQDTDIESRVYHTVQPRYYMQKGVIARNKLEDFNTKSAHTNPYYVNTNYYNKNEEDEVITFYAYFVNDSFEKLDLRETTIKDKWSGDLEFLGFNDIGGVANTLGVMGPTNEISDMKEAIYNTINSYNYNIFWVNDDRAPSPSAGNYEYPRNQAGFEKNTNIQISRYNGVLSSNEVVFNVNGSLNPGEGFYFIYSCKVKKGQVSENIENVLSWSFNGNKWKNVKKSDSIYVKQFYNRESTPNVAINSNDGECNIGTQRTDSKGVIYRENPSSSTLWSGVRLTPDETDRDIETVKASSMYIKKTDENGKEIDMYKTSMKFEILDQDKNKLNFTTQSLYYNEYDRKYYQYSESQTENTVTELTSSKSRIAIKGLPIGTYYIRETQAPNNYEINGDLIEFTITEEDIVPLYRLGKEVSIQNIYKNPQYNLTIEKIDSKTKEIITQNEAKFIISNSRSTTQNLVKFVELNIQDEEGNHYRLATEEDTDAVTELQTYQGKIKIEGIECSKDYYIYEKEAPWGYLKDSSYEYVSFDKTGDTAKTVKIENTANTNNVTISKVDSEEQLITEGTAKFQVQNKDGEKVYFEKLENSENSANYKMLEKEKEGATDTIETYQGKAILQYVPLGMYIIKEVEAPQGYVITNENITMNITSTTKKYEYSIKNGKAKGNINIIKTNTKGDIIEDDKIVFRLYDENDNLIKLAYKDEITEEGRHYYISEDQDENTYTQITTAKGKILIDNLPVGNYYLKEIVAPTGYSLYQDKIPVIVDEYSYITPTPIYVRNPEYIFGEEQYVSTSYQKIEEKDNQENYGYGYNGKASDYEKGNYNYILVDGKEDIITYTLRVANISKKNYKNLVLINKLADIGDTGVVNLNEARDSEFTIKQAKEPNFQIVVYNEQGEETILNSEEYKIEYSDNTEFTNGDWDGNENENWYETPTENTKSFRITFNPDFELLVGYSISIRFDGEIQENAEPGKIAWNSFGYRYYIGENSLTPEPPKVGVKIPLEPIITKTMTDGSNDIYYFDIYEQGKEEKITTIPVTAGESKIIPAKRIINGETIGYLEEGKTYIIKEQANTIAKIQSIQTDRGEIEENSYEFTYDKEKETKVEYINTRHTDGEIILTKVDKESRQALANAKYNLLDKDGNNIKLKKEDGRYIIAEDGEENILITDEEGMFRISGLPFGVYQLKEEKAPEGYITDTETIYTIEITSEDYAIENGIVVNIPKQIIAENEKKPEAVKPEEPDKEPENEDREQEKEQEKEQDKEPQITPETSNKQRTEQQQTAPKTGDNVPIIAITVILVVLGINLIQILICRKTKK